jgi:hypothetical protein
MVCYQVLAQFAFIRYKPVLVSTSIKKQHAPACLVVSGLLFSHRLKSRRFFSTQQQAAQYVSYLHAVYKISTAPSPAAVSGGQLQLF